MAEYLLTNQKGQVGYILNWLQKSQVLRSNEAAGILFTGLFPSALQGRFWSWVPGCPLLARSLMSFKLDFYPCKVKALMAFTSAYS